MQSPYTTPTDVWQRIPDHQKKTIREKQLRVFFIDMVKIARTVASEADLEMRMKDHSSKFEEITRDFEDYDENRRSDQKRFLDLHAEFQITRKRNEELREQLELSLDTIRQLDHRINEFMMAETERKQAQLAFIDQQNLENIERERSWRDALNHLEAA